MSARTFPRNTQYDHPVYIRMIGSRNSVPTRRKACVLSEEAASHRLKRCGTMLGHRLMAMPTYDTTKRAMAAAKSAISESLFSERHSAHATSAVMIGTGDSNRRLGQENHRCAISS